MNGQKYMVHRPGGGKLFGFAQTTDDCLIDKDSEVHGNAQIYNSTLKNCVVKGNAIVANAKLEDCFVEGNVLITGGQAKGCEFYDFTTMAEEFRARNSRFHGRARLFGHASAEYTAIRDAYIHGDATLIGEPELMLALDGLYRIGTGRWKQPPRFHKLEDLDIVALTESVDGFAYIGCERKTISQWIRQGNVLGKKFGWKQETVDRAKEIFREWATA